MGSTRLLVVFTDVNLKTYIETTGPLRLTRSSVFDQVPCWACDDCFVSGFDSFLGRLAGVFSVTN